MILYLTESKTSPQLAAVLISLPFRMEFSAEMAMYLNMMKSNRAARRAINQEIIKAAIEQVYDE